jgi:Secretin and TonB N terminus short domain.
MKKMKFTAFKVAFNLTVALGISSPIKNAYSTDNSKAYTIPSVSLSDALTQFSDQANIKLLFDPALTKNLNSPRLNGKITIDQGLKQLLRGSNLTYRVVDNNVYIVEPVVKPKKPEDPEAPSSSTLPTVKVTDTRLYDATDPYNTDYTLA